LIADYVRALRGFNRDVRLYLFTTALLGFAVFGGIYPVLFNLYLLRLGYGPDFVGLIGSVVGLAFAGFSLPAGLISRKWGGRRTMVAGMGIATVMFMLLPLAEFVPSGLRSGWLMVCSFTRATGFALYWVNARPFLMSATTEHERAHVYSVQGAMFPLTGFVGSLIAGLLPGFFARLLGVSTDHPAPYRYPLWMVSVLLVPAVIALRSIREFSTGQQPERRDRSERGRAPLALIGVLSVALFFQVTAQSALMGFFNVYMDDGLGVPTSTIGTLSAVAQLLSASAALVTPALSKRWGNRRTFVWSSLGAALCMLPLALVPHWAAVGLGYLGMTALYGTSFPAVNVYQMELVSAEWRTAMSGATAMANGLNWSATSFVGGQVIERWGYSPLFLASAGLTVIGALLFGAYVGKQRVEGREESGPPQERGLEQAG
jgi:MFS family permease